MAETKTRPPAKNVPPRYISGHCARPAEDAHNRCRGRYAGAKCACPCHDTPPAPTCSACGQIIPVGKP